MTTPRSRIMALLTVLAVLGVGVAIGVAVDRSLLRRQSDRSHDHRGGRGGGRSFGMMGDLQDTATRNRMRGRIVKRLTDELALTAVQVRQVDAIFATRERQLDTLRAHIAIDSMLTPSQRVKATAMRARWQDRRRRGGDDRGRRLGNER